MPSGPPILWPTQVHLHIRPPLLPVPRLRLSLPRRPPPTTSWNSTVRVLQWIRRVPPRRLHPVPSSPPVLLPPPVPARLAVSRARTPQCTRCAQSSASQSTCRPPGACSRCCSRCPLNTTCPHSPLRSARSHATSRRTSGCVAKRSSLPSNYIIDYIIRAERKVRLLFATWILNVWRHFTSEVEVLTLLLLLLFPVSIFWIV